MIPNYNKLIILNLCQVGKKIIIFILTPIAFICFGEVEHPVHIHL